MRRRIVLSFLILVLVFGMFTGCKIETIPTSEKVEFVKPEVYASVIHVEIDASFDIYINKNTKVVAIQPQNENAEKLDFSDVVGVKLRDAMTPLIEQVKNNGFINNETNATVTLAEGEETVAKINVIQFIKNAFLDGIAKEMVNSSLESVLMVRLNEAVGCHCVECFNWYETRYSYPDAYWQKWYDLYMTDWQKRLKEMEKNNDPLYESDLKSYESVTFEVYLDEVVKKSEYYRYEVGGESSNHVDKVITFKIIESQQLSEKDIAKECKEENLLVEKMQSVERLLVEVYVNGEPLNAKYSGRFYHYDGKWYANSGALRDTKI